MTCCMVDEKMKGQQNFWVCMSEHNEKFISNTSKPGNHMKVQIKHLAEGVHSDQIFIIRS